MGRPTNAEIYERLPGTIEPGAEGAIALAQSQYGNSKVIEAEVMRDDSGNITGYEVTLGWVDGTNTHIMVVSMDAAMSNLAYEERPNVPPGQEKPKHPKHEKMDKPLKERMKERKDKKGAPSVEAKVAHPGQV